MEGFREQGWMAAGGVLLRRLTPLDQGALIGHLLGLSEWDRVARWHGARSEDAIRVECAMLDLRPEARRALAFGAFGVGGLMLGAAIVARCAPGVAEMAVTVSEPWRRRGIGLSLVRLTGRRAARELGLPRICFPLDAENVPMRGLLRRVGARLLPCGQAMEWRVIPA